MRGLTFDIAHLLAGTLVLVSFLELYQDRQLHDACRGKLVVCMPGELFAAYEIDRRDADVRVLATNALRFSNDLLLQLARRWSSGLRRWRRLRRGRGGRVLNRPGRNRQAQHLADSEYIGIAKAVQLDQVTD